MTETNEEAMDCLAKLTNVIREQFDDPLDAETLQFYGAFTAMTWNAVVLMRQNDFEPMYSLLDGLLEHPEPEGRFLYLMAERIGRMTREEHAHANWLYKDVRVIEEGAELVLRAGTVSLEEWTTKGGYLSVT